MPAARKSSFTIFPLLLAAALLCLPDTQAQSVSSPGAKIIVDDDSAEWAVSRTAISAVDQLLRLGSQVESTELDCSHFVQSLFEQVGMYYPYAPSKTLYQGMKGFRRVFNPLPGDLVVWPGHVGIVVDPLERSFLSALRSGVKTSSYVSKYWKQRGRARFYRYRSPAHPDATWTRVARERPPRSEADE